MVHRTIVLLTVITEEVPHFDGNERVEVERLDEGFYRMRVRYGFMEDPDVPAALRRVREPQLDLESAIFFLGKEGIIPTARRRGMAVWRERLFAWMSRNSRGAVFFFCLPPEQTIELRGQVEI